MPFVQTVVTKAQFFKFVTEKEKTASQKAIDTFSSMNVIRKENLFTYSPQNADISDYNYKRIDPSPFWAAGKNYAAKQSKKPANEIKDTERENLKETLKVYPNILQLVTHLPSVPLTNLWCDLDTFRKLCLISLFFQLSLNFRMAFVLEDVEMEHH